MRFTVRVETSGRRAPGSAREVRELLAVLLLWGASAASAVATDLPAEVPCAGAVRQQLERWDVAGSMRRVAERPLEAARYAWPTSRIGVWLDLRVDRDRTVTLARVAPDVVTRLTWNTECQVTARTQVTSGDPSEVAASVTDADLDRFIATSPALAVYLWSPHMPLSVDGLQQASLASTRLGFAFLPVLDPRADRSYAARVAREAGLPPGATRRAASVELAFRDMLVHAPSLLLYVEGRAAGPAVPGYRDAAGYERVIREQRALQGRH